MKKTLIIVLILNFISCSTSKVDSTEMIYKTSFNDLKIVKTSKVINSDTINFNELRFYKIDSASDTMKSMYLDFGIWNSQAKGLHLENMNRKVWENIKLLKNDEVFTIIADGTETINDYYACLIVFDSKGKDCFEEYHPLKDKIINLFNQRIQVNRKKTLNHSLLR